MKKLSNRKIQGIIARKNFGFATKAVAERFRISERRVFQLCREFRIAGKPHELKKPGKAPKPISPEEEAEITEAHRKYRVCAKYLEKIIGLPHNKIHMILRKKGLAGREPNKSKRKKWVRYEREHSFSLVHLDWHEYKGKQIIFVEDDATRTILAGGEFDSASSENSIAVMKEAMTFASAWNSYIRQALTDNGAEFTITNRFNEEYEIDLMNHGFERFLAESGIEHTYTRRCHPQTNGKLEKLFDTHDKKRHYFKDLKEFIEWYNCVKPHMSMDFGTPSEALGRKLRTEELLGLACRVFGW